jgi:hypothetical protein
MRHDLVTGVAAHAWHVRHGLFTTSRSDITLMVCAGASAPTREVFRSPNGRARPRPS